MHASELVSLFRDNRESPVDLANHWFTPEHRQLFRSEPKLYSVLARRLIHADFPYRALEIIEQGLVDFPRDVDLRHLLALANERSGNLSECRVILDDLLRDASGQLHSISRAFTLSGRLAKEEYQQGNETAPQRMEAARRALACYTRAREILDTAFATINCATMSRVLGEVDQARELAERALEQVRSEAADIDPIWASATSGEACLILGRFDDARTHYAQAVTSAGRRLGDVASMRMNFELLAGVIPEAAELRSLFSNGCLVVCVGHLVDSPTAARQRFPNDDRFAEVVATRIAACLDDLGGVIGYCSGGSGADLLFAEAALKRRMELHLVLPFDEQDFHITSVDYGRGNYEAWLRRYQAVRERSTVHHATTELYLGDDELFRFNSDFIEGLALIHARRLGIPVHLLAVIDPDSPSLTGGTTEFVETWKQHGHEVTVIDLAAARQSFLADNEKFRIPDSAAGSMPRRDVLRTDIHRNVKAMLFADVKGFSQLAEEDAPAFFVQLVDVVAGLIAEADPPAFANTWGDGLFVVFDSIIQAADFAMRLVERIKDVEWNALSRPIKPAIRIGVHAGPVFRTQDKIIGRPNFFGRHVNLAARIEPVARANSVYASEQFAAMVAIERNHQYSCEYIGQLDLPKQAGRIPLYRLMRREG